MIVTISSGSKDVKAPTSVSVAAGASSATFKVTTVAVSTQETVSVGAKLAGSNVSSMLTLNPPKLLSIAFNPSSVVGGVATTGTITLSDPAPDDGLAVSLSSNSPAVSVPTTVTVSAGRTSATFSTKTLAVSLLTSVVVSASSNSASVQTTLTVNPPILKSLSVSPSLVKGGKIAQGTVTIGSAAPAGGLSIALSSNQASASVAGSVVILAGKTSVTFKIATTAVTKKTSATILASSGGVTKSASLTID
jgi:hypothetical protein